MTVREERVGEKRREEAEEGGVGRAGEENEKPEYPEEKKNLDNHFRGEKNSSPLTEDEQTGVP